MRSTALPSSALQHTLEREGFAFVRHDEMRELLASYGPLEDWSAFADSWNRLELDTYMADGGRYRRRRHATYQATQNGPVTRQPHQPHFQALDYNPLNGGIARWFEPIESPIGSGPTMTTILAFCGALFDRLAADTVRLPPSRPEGASASLAGAFGVGGKPDTTYDQAHPKSWHIEVHQFRIEARLGEQGRPTPEGLHRDGVDYVLVLLVARRNIASGVTSIHAIDDGRTLGEFTLTDPFDAALVDDARVAHGVTPVEPIDPDQPAYRDVLVVTFRKET